MLNDPTWTSKYGIEFDVSDYNIPWAIVLVTTGIYSLWLAWTNRPKAMTMHICPKCETAVDFRNVGNHTCPKCQTELEPLEGFYERHPELKDK